MYDSDETMESPLQMDATQPLSDMPTEESAEESPHEALPCRDGGEEEAPTATDALDPAADPEAPPQSPDPDPEADAADPQPDRELECLRRELRELKSEMEAQRRAFDRMGAECAEFCELYPEASPTDLPDQVWESMRRGVPLAAAYALYQRRRACIEEAAKRLNAENKSRSPGCVESPTGGYLSPDEVRAMTPAEVRANYQSILLSMQKWR